MYFTKVHMSMSVVHTSISVLLKLNTEAVITTMLISCLGNGLIMTKRASCSQKLYANCVSIQSDSDHHVFIDMFKCSFIGFTSHCAASSVCPIGLSSRSYRGDQALLSRISQGLCFTRNQEPQTGHCLCTCCMR